MTGMPTIPESGGRRTLYAGLALILAITCVGIFDHDLWTPDEPRAAELGREFLDPPSHWAVPTLNGKPFMEKPPLVYWTAAASFSLFGNHDWAARIPCMIFGWGTLLFVYLLARRMYGETIARSATLIMATSSGFLLFSHRFECDVGLIFFVAGGAYFMCRALHGSAWWYGLCALFALGGFFSKGLISFAFLGLLFLSFVLWTKNYKQFLRAHPWFWIPLISVPIALWFMALADHPRGNLLQTFLESNHLQRFFGGESYQGGHVQPFYYYLITFPIDFAPWMILILVAIPWIWSKRGDPSVRFLLSWFLPGFLFLCTAATKRGVYVVPLHAPLAILVAAWFWTKFPNARWLNKVASGLAILLIIAALALIPYIDGIKSMKAFCKKVGSDIPLTTELYAYGHDETVDGIIPFYTGRYLLHISNEKGDKALEKLAGRGSGKIAVLVLDKHDGENFRTVQKYFPYEWFSQDEEDRRKMKVFSNVPKEGS